MLLNIVATCSFFAAVGSPYGVTVSDMLAKIVKSGKLKAKSGKLGANH